MRGYAKSCGCSRNKTGKTWRRNIQSREHNSWNGMKERCLNPKATGYALYGGRGIRVCERWMTFKNFLLDMGPRPANTSLDRYPNPCGNYEPGNCRWASPKQQRNNRMA